MRCARFLSTPSSRRATIPIVSELKTGFEFLSTPSSRRATHPCLSILGKRAISIHALLAEGDCLRHSCGLHRKISIHALREEGDVTGCKLACRVKVFLSTPSARRATKHKKHHRFTKMNFYPRPPRGGRHEKPIAGSNERNFYPRPPRGGRLIDFYYFYCPNNFYPRPPRGGRRKASEKLARTTVFLSTPSARRATSTIFSMFAALEFLSTPSARRATAAAIFSM